MNQNDHPQSNPIGNPGILWALAQINKRFEQVVTKQVETLPPAEEKEAVELPPSQDRTSL